MGNRHIIKQAICNITCGVEEEAFKQQANWGVFAKNRLMPVVNQVFDERTASGRVFRIGYLEIDLRAVVYNDFNESSP